MSKKNKINYLLEKIINLFSSEAKGKVLDLGCGDGDYSVRLKNLGFNIVAADMDIKRFRHDGEIDFMKCNVTQRLPFADEAFDYVLLAEVIEHLSNPHDVLGEIQRILKQEGQLILSTPNILSLKSRFRYLFEGCYDFFREPPLDQSKNPREVIFNLHIVPYRYHELEYLLSTCGFAVASVTTSVCEGFGYGILLPIIKLQAFFREARALKKGSIDYRRINKLILSKEMLFGRHLIIKAKKIVWDVA